MVTEQSSLYSITQSTEYGDGNNHYYHTVYAAWCMVTEQSPLSNSLYMVMGTITTIKQPTEYGDRTIITIKQSIYGDGNNHHYHSLCSMVHGDRTITTIKQLIYGDGNNHHYQPTEYGDRTITTIKQPIYGDGNNHHYQTAYRVW